MKKVADSAPEHLRKAREGQSLSRNDAVAFFRRLGYDFSSKSLQNWENGNRQPRKVDLERLTELLERRAAIGENAVIREEQEQPAAPLAAGEGNGEVIPFFDAGGGIGKEGGEGTITIGRSQLRSSLGYAPSVERLFAVRVIGHSMEPWIRDRQIVICEEVRTVGAPGRYVYWLDSEEGYVVKDIEPAGDGALRITQHGPNPRTDVLEPVKNGEPNTYRDRAGRAHMVKIKGRVIFPDDTARALLTRLENSLRKIVGQR